MIAVKCVKRTSGNIKVYGHITDYTYYDRKLSVTDFEQFDHNSTYEDIVDRIGLENGTQGCRGHTISWGNQGEWVWDEERKNCTLQKVLGTQYQELPLKLIVLVWDYWRKHGSTNRGLFNRYKTILVFYYRDHPEEIEYDE